MGFIGVAGRARFSGVAKRRQLCVLQGEHARNVQGSRNHKSKNDNCYAFYEEHKPADVRCRGITSPKTTTVLHFATTKNKKSNQIEVTSEPREKSQANPLPAGCGGGDGGDGGDGGAGVVVLVVMVVMLVT